MVDAMLLDPKRAVDVKNLTHAKMDKAYNDVLDAVKAVLLISGADKRRHGRLKDDLANNYLLRTDQYPDIFETVLHNLGNYQVPRTNLPFRGSSQSDGVVFIQCGCGAGQRAR
jgi:hypothetical protein